MNVQATGQPAAVVEPDTAAGRAVTTTNSALIGASIATVALALIALLALSSAAQPTHADRAMLLCLAILGAVCLWTPLSRWCAAADGSGTFALTAGMFILYGMARQTPAGNTALHFSVLPDDSFPVSCAAFVVVLGALITAPFWYRGVTGWTKAVALGAALLTAIGFFSLKFLGGYYPVGATEVVNPTAFVHLGMQAVEYTALALLCNAATMHPTTRRWALRVLPAILLLVWLRHHFSKPPAEEAQ